MLTSVVIAFHALLTVGLIAVILMQSGKSAGLGSLGGGGETIFGKKRKGFDQMLSRATVWLAAFFMISALLVSIIRG
ncbi:MAG: preprotein translocase subunit SecG [Bacillota bacterium]